MSDLYGRPSAEAYLSRLLSFALRADAEAVATALIERYGRIDTAASVPVRELLTVPGMTENAAILLNLSAALTSRRVTDGFPIGSVPTEEQIRDYLVALYIGVSVETVYMLVFDKDGRVSSVEYMGEGTVSSSDVYPRRLLEEAIRKQASSVILVHNHPRATCTPSREDEAATQMLHAVFKTAGIDLRAHYVVAERSLERIRI